MLLSLVGARGAWANWQWQLSPERYKGLNQFERAQYDKAAALVTAGNYPAAASEFEKFKVQFEDSSVLSYAIFMRGFSLHQAKNRHTAVKVYQEVLDYFADQTDDAVASLYFMGVAHLDNGDTLKGLTCMKSLVENPAYQKHPLAAGALRRLAENHWNNKQLDEAARYWRQAVRDFGAVNQAERDLAVAGLAQYHLLAKEYVTYEQAVTDDTNRENPAHRKWVVDTLWQRAWQIYNANPPFDRKRKYTEKEIADEQRALYEYLKASKPWWEKANDPFGFYDRALTTQLYLVKDAAERDRLVEEAVALAKATQAKDKVAGDNQLARLADILRDGQVYDRARYCASVMSDRIAGAYKDYEITAREAKWDAAVAQLEAIEAGAASPEWKTRAMGERARLYGEVLNRQDDAIKLYQQLNNPPHNLWAIQACYKRAGKLDNALGMLTEIENSFPDQSSRAAWHKAAYLDEAGDQKKAVAAARRILKLYPKSGESSQAHQLLEKYGIATGGGLAEEQQ